LIFLLICLELGLEISTLFYSFM